MQQAVRSTLIGMAVLLLVVTCVIPGVILQTMPTSDAHALSTIIAGTSAAAVAQTQTASSPTQAPTPVPTGTPIPSAIPTVSVFSPEGTALLRNGDGSTAFVDQAGGYELTVPAGWLLVRTAEKELQDAWRLPEASDPKVQNFLHEVEKSDPESFRLFAADTFPDRYQSAFVTNFNVFWDRNNSDSLEKIIELLKTQLPTTFLNANVTSGGVNFTSSQVPIGIIESTSTLLTDDGWPVNLYQKQVVFRLRTGALTIVLSTTSEVKDAYLPGFNTMVDQIILNVQR